MYCSKCGSRGAEGLSFRRVCGAHLGGASLARRVSGSLARRAVGRGVGRVSEKDPDEMTAEGIGGVIVGDGFFITAVILSATNTPISSMLWLLLLIPAFYCFGMGMKEVLHARQIRRRRKQGELSVATHAKELPPPRASVADIIRERTSGGLLAAGRTTGEL